MPGVSTSLFLWHYRRIVPKSWSTKRRIWWVAQWLRPPYLLHALSTLPLLTGPSVLVEDILCISGRSAPRRVRGRDRPTETGA